ncbi:acyltransferase [Candidimonas sp. SYP-B2681]|uniref:acyltransferase n=1 Tax=Candidimonas sp. SYP-B2681 TaxID=2497686 RepID=UPI001315201F|nr:acyltransferase family protein [Candidimonas sp. SYP-B2681]
MSKGSFSAGMDTARIGACFMVIVLHVAATQFHVFDGQWWASNFYDSLTRSCVPIFLMVSGVLLLNKQEGLPAFFTKRFARILPPLLFWSLFYMMWNTSQGTDYGGWIEWLKTLASGPVVYHLWYLYAILGIYLFVPFLRNIWLTSTRSEKRLFLAFWMLVSGLPIVQTVMDIDLDLMETYGLGSFFGLIGYLFLGAYVLEVYQERSLKNRYWWGSAGLFIVFSAMTMMATFVYSRHMEAPDALFYDYLSPLVMAASVCIFNVLYGLGVKLRPYSGILSRLSACTFGVYCIHIFILDRTTAVVGMPGSSGSAWLSIPAMAAFVFGVSLLLIMLLRRFRPFLHVT